MSDQPVPLSYGVTSESATRGVIVTDKQHRVQFTDASICSLLGVEASDLIGKNIVEVASSLSRHFTDPSEFERRTVWLCENPLDAAEDVIEMAAPEKRILHRYSAPLLDENHEPVARIEVYSDITKRRRLEDANVTLYKQVCATLDELKAAQDQLVQTEKLHAIGEIAHGVAHDFNNTLGVILGNIQLLLRSKLDERVGARLRAIEQAALDAADTVRRIREFTSMQPDEELKSVDLSALVLSVLDVMQAGWETAMQARDVQLKVDLSLEQGVLAAGVPAEIREVLTNILNNSIQAMPEGGTMRVSTGHAEGYAFIEIVDSGVGMGEDALKRIFDPFFTTKGVEGTGLGMSVAYGIVKRHRGNITVSSRPGEGTTVNVFLRTSDGLPQDTAASRPAPASEVAPIRILIVDDEEAFAGVFTDMLSEYNHEVCTARNGFEAIERFKADAFDIVFTDLGMPGMSGWQVAKSIKDIRPSTPVVLLTGWGAEVEEAQLAESKVDMVLCKPVDLNDLSAVISRALGEGK